MREQVERRSQETKGFDCNTKIKNIMNEGGENVSETLFRYTSSKISSGTGTGNRGF